MVQFRSMELSTKPVLKQGSAPTQSLPVSHGWERELFTKPVLKQGSASTQSLPVSVVGEGAVH